MGKRKGFSLLEVILIIAVLSLGFYPLILSLSRVLVGAGQGESGYLMAHLARQKMELVKATPFDNITAEAQTAIAHFPGYSSQVSVEVFTNLKDITVRIGHNSQNLIIKTLISNYDS